MRALMLPAILLVTSMSAAPAFAHDNDPPLLKVYDAQGKVIGRFDYQDRAQGVFVRVNGADIFLPIEHRPVSATEVSIDQFQWAQTLVVGFASKDCTGPAFPSSFFGAPRPSATVRAGVEATVYIAGTGLSGSAQIGSSYENGQCVASGSDWPQYWKAESSYSLTEHYPEPLSVHY
jgi:hypothetical protein